MQAQINCPAHGRRKHARRLFVQSRRARTPVAAAALWVLATSALSAVQYEVTTVASPAGFNSAIGRGLNNAGEVVGSAFIGSGPGAQERAFVWRNGSFVDLGTVGASSRANAINDAGLIVGLLIGRREARP